MQPFDIGIYHSKDNDGLTCGVIMRKRFPNIKLIPFDYKDDPKPVLAQIPKGSRVMMSDVTLEPADMLALREKASYFVLLDHHDPKFDTSILDEFKFSKSVSASELTWQYCFPDKAIPESILFIGIYDTFRIKEAGDLWETAVLPTQVYLNAFFGLEHIEAFMADKKEAIKMGQAMLQFEKGSFTAALDILNIGQEVYLDGHRCFAANTTGNASRFSILVFERFPKAEFLIIYYQLSSGKFKYSMRRKQGAKVDLGAIAKKYGGGGRAQTASFTLEELIF